MKIRITYTEAEKQLFERIRADLIQSIPGQRIHESSAPGGYHVWYLKSKNIQNPSCKKQHIMV